jgi:hypothetical protein
MATSTASAVSAAIPNKYIVVFKVNTPYDQDFSAASPPTMLFTKTKRYPTAQSSSILKGEKLLSGIPGYVTKASNPQ